MQDKREIVIHGGGYVGVTGAIHLALAGWTVTIYDPDKKTVDGINEGTPRTQEYLGYIDRDVKLLVGQGKLKATTDFDSVAKHYVHILSVPTERNDKPDMKIVSDCIARLSYTLPVGGLIIIESTLQPGTIDTILQTYPLSTFGKEWLLAVAPRLDWFADRDKNVTNLPRIVGGVTPECTKQAIAVLSTICKDIHPTTYRIAEFAKAGQNHLYFVQIQAAYEMARVFHNNADMNEALRLIGLHWRLPELYIGAGVSGRCIQMGSQYIEEAAQSYMPIAEAALAQDKNWRQLIADRLVHGTMPGRELKILIMGIAYRANFSDFGYSAGLGVAKLLKEQAWDVEIEDPIVPHKLLEKTGIKVGHLYVEYDAILLATAHDAFATLPDYSYSWRSGQFVLDATGLWERYRSKFEAYGVKYIRVGEQDWMTK